jgi:anti-sigma-K factor RskA
MQTDPHRELQELCALSTTGELTAEEWERLTEHLAQCESCREDSRAYDQLFTMAMPALGVELYSDLDDEQAPDTWSIEDAQKRLMESLGEGTTSTGRRPVPERVQAPWNLSNWWRYAAAAVVLATSSLSAYRLGLHNRRTPDMVRTPVTSSVSRGPSSIEGVPIAALPDDPRVSALQNQARVNHRETVTLKDRLAVLESELADRSADLDRSMEERADLNRKLAQAQSNALSLEARLNLIGKETSEDTQQSLALKGQVNDLNKAIEEKNKQIAESTELLDRDRDIRNLIGARDLYVAEIYDVGLSGDTQKPFGRVFYTKDKSLIFYGYDLDQQPGIKKAGVFQAWGGRGGDRKHAVSLGLLYKDDANQKRWVLKSNDAKTIAQIDTVFITVEPEGGSTKPSGKPLLLSSLRVAPNHP